MNCAFCHEPMHPADTVCSQCGEPLNTDITLSGVSTEVIEAPPWESTVERLREWRDAAADAPWAAVVVGSLVLGGAALFLGLSLGRLASKPDPVDTGSRRLAALGPSIALPPPPAPALTGHVSRVAALPRAVVPDPYLELMKPLPPSEPAPRRRRRVRSTPSYTAAEPLPPSHTLAQDRALPRGHQRVVLLPTFPNMEVSVDVYPGRR